MTPADMHRPVQIIINPHSGYGGNRQKLLSLRSAFRERGLQSVEYVTTCAGDATRYARAVAPKTSVVVVWGGDGTANEVANGLAGTGVPMIPCPVGTENLLAKELRIPSHPRRIAEIVAAGQTVDCDLGRINDRNFLMIIGIGFDAEVVRRLSSQRSGHISHLSYFWPMWRTFWEHDFPRMRIFAEGEELFEDYALAFVGNISRYATGLRICRDARFDDGLLDLVVFPCREQSALLLHAAWTLLRLHPLKGGVIYRRVHRVRIETDRPTHCQVDGDLGPNTPVDISVAPEKIKLMVPPQTNGWTLWPWRGGA